MTRRKSSPLPPQTPPPAAPVGPAPSAAAPSAPTRADVYARDCPSRVVLDHLTSRWGVLVLIALLDGAMRFSALRRRIGGVSEKMLAQTLHVLEADGFVHREVFPVIPPHVEYRLTPLGEDAARHVRAFATWIEDNLDRVQEARRARAER